MKKEFMAGVAVGLGIGLTVYIFSDVIKDKVNTWRRNKLIDKALDELKEIMENKDNDIVMGDILPFPTQVTPMGKNTGTVVDYTKPVIYGASEEPFHENVHIEPEEKEHILPDDIFVSKWSLVKDAAMREELWDNSHYYDAFDDYDMFEYEWCQDTGHLYFSNVDGFVLDDDFDLFDPIDFEDEFGNCYNLCERIFLSNDKHFIAKITIREEDMHVDIL